MGFIVLLVIVIIFAIYVFIQIKISNLRNRAKQQILKDTGLSSSDINAGIMGGFEKKYLQKFLNEHPNYTEESLKNLFVEYSKQIIFGNSQNEFSQAVYEKMQKDTKLEKFQNMEFRRANINYYNNSKLNAIVVYTDNKDEYEMSINCSVLGDRIQVDNYQIIKGAVVGF